jgi:hypothetical protein
MTMDKKIVTETKKKSGYKKIPIPGPGRPKGSKDKLPRSVKGDIEEAFRKLGGVDGLVKWAQENKRIRAKVYDWYFSMLPKNVDASVAGDLGLTIHRIIEDRESAE